MKTNFKISCCRHTSLSPSLSTLSPCLHSLPLSVRARALRRLVSSRQMIFGFLYKSRILSCILFALSHLSANCKQSLAYKSSYTINDVCICICMSVQRVHRKICWQINGNMYLKIATIFGCDFQLRFKW